MGPKVELRGEDVIQAVVVADSFSSAFAPLTLSSPGCLLPLAGRPLLEYTLEVQVTSVADILYLLDDPYRPPHPLRTRLPSPPRGAPAP